MTQWRAWHALACRRPEGPFGTSPGPVPSATAPTHYAQVELRVLDYLIDHDPSDSHNCVRMTDSFMFRGHLCITFELLGMNL